MELWRQLCIHIVCIRKQGRVYLEHDVLKLRLDHNNLDKAMEDNPSVIECQHIAWCPVCDGVSVFVHTLWPGLSPCVQCGPCWLGGRGEAEATAEAAWWPSPASQPLDTGRYSVTENFLSNQNTIHHIMHAHIRIICVTAECLWILSCVLSPDYMYSRGGDGSVECGVSPSPRGRGGQRRPGPPPVPAVTSLCSVLPLSSPSPSVSSGHGDQEDAVRTSGPGTIRSISKVTLSHQLYTA